MTFTSQFSELIDRPVSSKESIAIQKARQLYTSCMHNSFRTSHFKDYKHLPIYQVLSAEGVGEWPILQGTSWNRSEFNLERLLGQLFTHQVQSIFELYVTQDEVEPTKYLLQVIYYLRQGERDGSSYKLLRTIFFGKLFHFSA